MKYLALLSSDTVSCQGHPATQQASILVLLFLGVLMTTLFLIAILFYIFIALRTSWTDPNIMQTLNWGDPMSTG